MASSGPLRSRRSPSRRRLLAKLTIAPRPATSGSAEAFEPKKRVQLTGRPTPNEIAECIRNHPTNDRLLAVGEILEAYLEVALAGRIDYQRTELANALHYIVDERCGKDTRGKRR